MGKKKVVKKKKKNKPIFLRKKFLTRLLIMSVLIYFFIMSIPIIRTSNARTIPIEKDDVVDIVTSKGIILRDETIYKSEAKGQILFSAEEGERLSKGTKIAEITNATYESYKSELAEVDREIEEYNRRISSQKETLKKDITKNQGEIDFIIKEVQKNVASQNYEEVKRLKDRLLIISDKKDAITNEKTLIMDQLGIAMKKKSEIVNKMKQASLIYYNGNAGIMTRTIDGFEEEYSSASVAEYKISDLKTLEAKDKIIKDNDEMNVGDPIFKIIEGQRWFVMANIQGDELSELKKGQAMSIMVNDNKQKIEGKILKLEKSKKGTFLIVELDKHLHDFYKEKEIDLKVVKDTYSGFKVPRNAVIEKDDVKGVFIRAISGEVKFRSINVLKEMEDLIIIEAAEPNEDQEDKEPLKLLDEVFIDGRKIKEGQLVNSKGGV